ncbi:MAG: hypothetical protein IJO32_02925 [Bacilli bacterium]|nr:hypothetical protein [Bacilli bacterium]
MARKDLSDFNYDYQAYANYLESAECTNDEGYDIVADHHGNIYTPTDGDWTKGHGHRNDNTNYDRPAGRSDSIGRNWKNNWLKYASKLNLTQEEAQFLNCLYNAEKNIKSNENINKPLSKRR